MKSDFLWPFFSGLILSCIFVFIVRFVCRKNKWVAQPKKDRWHQKATALHGGVGIMASWLIISAALFLKFAPIPSRAWAILLTSSFMFLLGLLDDVINLRPLQKLLGQVLAASILIFLGSIIEITPWPAFNILVSLVWLVGLTNAMNLIDNMDGLSIGIIFIACLNFIFLFGPAENMYNGLTICWLWGMAGSALGFLIFNFNPASIFMGDSGSLFLGFFLAAISIPSDLNGHWVDLQSPIEALWPILILIVPIFDTTFVSLCRLLNGRKISQGGRDHLSHRLVKIGLSEKSAVFSLYGLALASGAIAFFGHQGGRFYLWLVVGMVTIIITGAFFLGRLNIYGHEKKVEKDITDSLLV